MLPDWRLGQILIAILFLNFIFIPTTFAIGVGFSVSDNTGSVGILDYYFVSDSVSVHESGTGGFSPASISSSRAISGSGSINMMQKYRGSGGYTGHNYLFSKNATNNDVESTAALSPNSLSVSQSASFANADLVKFSLGACIGCEYAEHHGQLEYGSLNMDQSLNANRDGISAIINARLDARNATVASKAMDGLGSSAETEVSITQGQLTTTQIARELTTPENMMAMASQVSNLSALAAIARSMGKSYTGNEAGVLVELVDGKMTTEQNAWADKIAWATETTRIWDAQGASSSSYAQNAEGDRVFAKTNASMSRGSFNSSQMVIANNSLDLSQQVNASRALSTTSYAYALIHNKFLARTFTRAEMDLGDFSSTQWANVNKSIDRAVSYQYFNATEALLGSKY